MARDLGAANVGSALLFGGAATHRVESGASSTALANLDPCTYLMWAYPTSLATNKSLVGKGVVSQNLQVALRTTGDIDIFRHRASTSLNYRSTGLAIAVNTWNLIAIQIDTASAQTGRIFRGLYPHIDRMAEASYTISTAGSGALLDDSAGPIYWGNIFGSPPGSSLVGRLAVGAVFARLLSIPEMIAWGLSALEDTPAVMHGCRNLMYFGNEGAANVLDYSGYNNLGVVTGATLANGLALPQQVRPVRPRFKVATTTAYSLSAAAGSFALTGVAAGLLAARKITSSAGSFVLSGQNVGLLAARRLTSAVGSFALSGKAAGLYAGRMVGASAGAFSLSGQTAGLLAARRLTVGTGAFVLTGIDATLTYSAAATVTATLAAGKYAPEHASASSDIAAARGFASEHAGAANDLRDAGL